MNTPNKGIQGVLKKVPMPEFYRLTWEKTYKPPVLLYCKIEDIAELFGETSPYIWLSYILIVNASGSKSKDLGKELTFPAAGILQDAKEGGSGLFIGSIDRDACSIDHQVDFSECLGKIFIPAKFAIELIIQLTQEKG